MEKIDFKLIEQKWQKKWEELSVFSVNEHSKKPKYYVLEMFPYPSGAGLHIGHVWNYTIGDIYSRFKKMQGFNVLHPMGFDALGLPAENAAIKEGIHPKNYTDNSIKNFLGQLKFLGFSYDYSRLLNTANPDYYKWDQWIFLKLFEKGLAYKKTSNVNWCRECNTVLANEQVHDGKCWRHSDVEIEIKNLEQWFFKTTHYADELNENLKNMDWPERTKIMQKNWIGKSHGTEIDFEIDGEKWPVFTTRPDTIFGVTFVVVSAQHEKLWNLVSDEQKEEVEKFLKNLKSVSEKEMADMEKEGVFTGSYAINPVNGEEIPIYAGNFVVADYGSGMVMAVPAHDQRDFDFAKKYNLEIREVVEGGDIKIQAYTGNGNLKNSKEFSGLDSVNAREKITAFLSDKNKGRKVTNFRLRDWGISRQRYWGTPIPIINCSSCGAVPVPEKDLPVELPKNVKFGSGNPLSSNEEWINVKCPKCGGPGRREIDTMDTFVNSSWYFLRYCDPNNEDKIFDNDKVEYWSPVNLYIGGAEHACMHLIYSRFYVKFLRDLGLLNFDEPAEKLFHQGMLHASDGNKMSKSLGNTINPLDIVKNYGSDSLRLALMSFASPDKDTNWDENVLIGSYKFLNKIMNFFNVLNFGKSSSDLEFKLNKVVQNITKYFEELNYRKATIEIRSLFDFIISEGKYSRENLETALQLLNPFCPHLTEEVWEKMGHEDLIANSSWPEVDVEKIKNKDTKVDLNQKIILNVKRILSKVEKKGEIISKIYLYVLPFEIEKVDLDKIKKEIKKDILIYSVRDENKHDPENKAKKAKPGMPGVYLE